MTEQTSKDSLQVPELTPEQQKRWNAAITMSARRSISGIFSHKHMTEALLKELALQRMEYENVLNEAIELLEEQMDDEPCSYDHHGYCQTHWGGTDEDPTFCGMKKSKKVIQKCKALLQKETI